MVKGLKGIKPAAALGAVNAPEYNRPLGRLMMSTMFYGPCCQVGLSLSLVCGLWVTSICLLEVASTALELRSYRSQC